jgi:hypothetical protein
MRNRPAVVGRLPSTPGVYRFRDARDRVLYIGRACALRRRVASYWSDLGERGHLAAMVARIVRIEAVSCDSAHEAVWLERNLLQTSLPPSGLARLHPAQRRTRRPPPAACIARRPLPIWQQARRPSTAGCVRGSPTAPAGWITMVRGVTVSAPMAPGCVGRDAGALPGPLRCHDRKIVSARRGSKQVKVKRERNPIHA